MSDSRHDLTQYHFGRAPRPADLCRHYSRPDAVIAVIPLPQNGGVAVMAIVHTPRFSVHPLAAYSRTGEMVRFSTQGLVNSSHPAFVYEVKPDRPLRTAADPKSLAERWARENMDMPWVQRGEPIVVP